MKLNNHTDFILSPITIILEDAVSASSGIGNGIETYPLYDYIMQSTFLKMTGFQEQKMKCICWELATNDYEYRREFLDDKLGECSSYPEKQKVYKDLIKQTKKHFPTFNVAKKINKKDILASTKSLVKEVFLGTNLLIWAQSNFHEYDIIWKKITDTYFANDDTNLFTGISDGTSLKDIYVNHLHKHRNRIAHNALSYQQNLPTLKTLMSDNQIYNNYFIYFTILILLDKTFIALYREYLEAIRNN